MTEQIVYVHGVWMPGEEMLFLQHHIQRQYGISGQLFDYPSVRGTLEQNAELLADFVTRIDADQVHFVGHSLGGIVALKMLELSGDARPGRVVCLGSPLKGSKPAHFLSKTDWGNRIIGKTLTEGAVDAPADVWATTVTADRDVGSLAGVVSRGLGRFVTPFEGENDGTVAVSETQIEGLKDHICMPVSHSGMVMSGAVADQAAIFINDGSFKRAGE